MPADWIYVLRPDLRDGNPFGDWQEWSYRNYSRVRWQQFCYSDPLPEIPKLILIDIPKDAGYEILTTVATKWSDAPVLAWVRISPTHKACRLLDSSREFRKAIGGWFKRNQRRFGPIRNGRTNLV